MESDTLRRMIESGLPDSMVRVTGDDGQHFEAVIVSDAFIGKNMLEQHRMVYAALQGKMGREIHALSIRTFTREEWKKHAP